MNSRQNQAGFTLLELLAAAAITLVLAGLMLAVATQVLATWRKAQDVATAGIQAKLALDLLQRDLQSARHRREGVGITWLAADVTADAAVLVNRGWQTSPNMKPARAESWQLVPETPAGAEPLIGGARFGLSGVWLRGIVSNIESEGSAPVAVSYQIARRPLSGSDVSANNPAEVRYTLFRSAVSAENTFAVGYDVRAGGYGSASPRSATMRAASTLTNPHTAGDALLTNAVDFGVWFYVRDDVTGALVRVFPADRNDFDYSVGDAPAPIREARFPDVADVMIRVLTDEGARLLAAVERGDAALVVPAGLSREQWWWQIVTENSRVYTRRIVLKGETP